VVSLRSVHSPENGTLLVDDAPLPVRSSHATTSDRPCLSQQGMSTASLLLTSLSLRSRSLKDASAPLLFTVCMQAAGLEAPSQTPATTADLHVLIAKRIQASTLKFFTLSSHRTKTCRMPLYRWELIGNHSIRMSRLSSTVLLRMHYLEIRAS
jgi:hypothetical protein